MLNNLKIISSLAILAGTLTSDNRGADMRKANDLRSLGWFNGDNYEYDERLDLDFSVDEGFDYLGPKYDEAPAFTRTWEDRDTQRSPAQARNRAQWQNNQRTIRGQVEDWAQFHVYNLRGDRDRHTVARVRLQDGRSVLINLGSDPELSTNQIEKGDDILAEGRTGTLSGRRVLMAERIEVDGRTYNPRDARGRGDPLQRASFRGRVEDFQWVDVNGGGPSGRVMARVAVEDGRSVLVDLGAARELADLHVSRNDFIRVNGWRDSAEGRPVLRANEVWVNGQRTFIRGAGRPRVGMGTSASGEQGANQNQRSVRRRDNTPDESILHTLRREFQYSPKVEEEEIQIGVNNGVVTLRGDVDTLEQKRAASLLAEEADGVSEVENLIKVRSPETLPPELLEFRVQAALGESTLKANQVEVDANIGRVTLSGEVSSYEDRAEAEQIATDVPGVWDVINNLQVAPGSF